MKKQICFILALCLVITLSGCFRADNSPSQTPNNTTGNQETQTKPTEPNFNETMVAVSVPTITDDTVAEDGTVICQYTYQHMSLVLHKPDVADKIILDFLNRVDTTTGSAEDIAEMAKQAYSPSATSWIPYLYHITYSPTRVDHQVLSLFGNNVVFSGAGHPERTCTSANYDLLTGDVLTLASIMTQNSSTEDFCNLVLDGLSEMAEGDYLYEDYKATVKKRFNSDATKDEAWYFTQTGLCFYFSPYEIAPYSSGIISVEIPYEKLEDLLHEAYFPAGQYAERGSVKITPFEEANLDNFSHIAELVTNKDGKMYMLSSDGSIQNVRIQLSDKTGNYTVFAAYSISQGDGIMIQADDSLLQNMRITYKTGTEIVTAPIIG